MNRKLSRLNAALVLGALVGIMILAGGCGSSALVPTATIPLPAKIIPTTEPPPAVGDGSVILAGEDDAIARRVRVSTPVQALCVLRAAVRAHSLRWS